MANQQNQSGSNPSSRIPENASETQASQILGYGVGDIVTLGEFRTSDQLNGGTSTGNTPNSTNSPGMAKSGSDMANINVDYSSGNSASLPQDSHQATMSNASPGQRFRVSKYDESARLFWAYKLNEDGTIDSVAVPLAPDENYQIANGD